MRSDNWVEHFVTLFDQTFLPMGLCLHSSMLEHAEPFHLWIVCMDETVERQLRQLDLPHVSIIALSAVDTDALRKVKIGRTRVEYCWTLTPFTPQFVFDRDRRISRVTYLDADLFFFDSPRLLLEEFEASGKDVLITEHGYAPEYDQSQTSGRFCVQFMTFRHTDGALKVMQWWQDKCLEWCFSRCENGKLGDQKYLDTWPERFADEVHVLKQVEKTLAPWNVNHFTSLHQSRTPVLYHFHSLRIVSATKVVLYVGYRVGDGRWMYDRYVKALRSALLLMKDNGMSTPIRPPYPEKFHTIRVMKRLLLNMEAHATI